MDIILENVGGESPEPVGGLVAEFYIAPHKDFSAIQDPPNLDDYTNITDLVTIATAHTFPAGKGFIKAQGVVETGNLKNTMIGNPGGRLFQNELIWEMSGSNAEVLGFLRLIKNGKFIVLAEEAGTGAMRQFGSKRFPATFTGIEAAMEAAMEGKNSVTLTVQDKQRWPAPIYSGAVTLKP